MFKASAGFNIGRTNSTTDSQWVNEQTSIIGDNNVNIKVGSKENAEGNTNIVGGLIASGSYNNETGNFEDNGNLSLNTNSLTYQDLNDYYTSTTKGSGLTTNVGTSSESFFKGIAPNGTTTITLVNSGEDKKQDTRATIGLGNIVIGNKEYDSNNKPLTPTPLPQGARDILAGLNRDMTKSQETTQDQITGALNGEMKIDNRIFGAIRYGDKESYEKDENGNPILDENGNQKVITEKGFDVGDGWKSIYSDVRNVGGNTKEAIIGASRDAD